MRVRLRCLNESCGRRFETHPETAGEVRCPDCAQVHVLGTQPAGTLTVCPVCGGDELYVRKDFPQRLGVLLVTVVGLTSIWFFARGQLLWSMGVLLGLVIVDMAIYYAVPRITVCYRCRAEFRDTPVNPEHTGFDLATAEKYR